MTLPPLTHQHLLNGRRSDQLPIARAPEPSTRNFLLKPGVECVLDGRNSDDEIRKFLGLIGAPWIEELTRYQSFIGQRQTG